MKAVFVKKDLKQNRHGNYLEISGRALHAEGEMEEDWEVQECISQLIIFVGLK